MLAPEILHKSTQEFLAHHWTTLGETLSQVHGSDKVANFALVNPGLSPPPGYCDALREITATEVPLCHGYGFPIGDLKAREAFAALFTDLEGVSVRPEHVVCASGSSGALNITLRAILSLNDQVILVGPSEESYAARPAVCYGRVIEFSTKFEDDWQIDFDKFSSAVNPETRVILIQSPQNPTGIIYSQDRINQIGELLKTRSAEYGRPIWLVSDNVFGRILAPEVKCHQVLNAYPYSVICYSLSQDLSIPGERIGCVVVNPLLEGVDLLVRALGHVNELTGFVHAHRLHQRLIPKVVNERITVDIKLYNQSREIICQTLDECGIKYTKPKGGFFVFPKIPDGVDEGRFCEELAKRLVVVVPGKAFKTPGFYRITFAEAPDVVQAKAAIFKAAYTEVIAELS